jgi:ABC-type transport system involved in multi-copper enzyme maturation permease subunit
MLNLKPLVVKELRPHFRHARGPVILFFYLLVLGGFTLGYLYLTGQASAAVFDPARSRAVFSVLSVAQLILLAFVTPGLTAGSISGERERQTLNVLLLTDLSPARIVAGKMISSCAFTILLVLATLPLYGIVLVFGGVAPAQLGGVFGFYLATMFLFAAVGTTCSAHFKRTGTSTVTAYGITAFLMAGTGFLAAFIYEAANREVSSRPPDIPVATQFLMDINPLVVLFRILGEGAPFGGEWLLPYWLVYPTFYLGVGLLLLWWSSRMLDPLKKPRWKNLIPPPK